MYYLAAAASIPFKSLHSSCRSPTLCLCAPLYLNLRESHARGLAIPRNPCELWLIETVAISAMGAVGNIVVGSVAAAWEESNHMHVWALVLIVTLLLMCIVLGHLLEESRFFNEATIAILLVSLPSISAAVSPLYFILIWISTFSSRRDILSGISRL